MSGGRRERWLRVGGLELGIALPERLDRRLERSGLARALARLGRRRVPARLPESDAPLPERRPEPADLDPASRPLLDKVAEMEWYHSIDLGHGVVTPGLVDHRPQLDRYHLPHSLAGMRCLDVASWDGFFAFEMERRGADEVISFDLESIADIDIPGPHRAELVANAAGRRQDQGFRLAHEVLGSRVERKTGSVYRLSPELAGSFDLVIVSDLLLHLRDPQLALDHIATVCRGTLLLADVYHPPLERYGERSLAEYSPWLPGYTWWQMNVSTLRKMLDTAGFTAVEELERFEMRLSSGGPGSPKVVLRAQGPARAEPAAVTGGSAAARRTR
ncbi:MAG TPA: methyltransferase domain-containing protein [Candidatus Dormibacteraeota bacterium]|nr:methyltransferase domain-containing protein [Candidatus Dormibacteraeota bacterium]